MMGLIVGDALGVPVQFLKRENLKNRPQGKVTGMEAFGSCHQPAGTWSDDSSMALATYVSIREKDGIDRRDIADRFVAWLYHGAYTPFERAFDEGITCTEAIERYVRTGDVNTCGRTGEHANGNGALMRILPVCLYYYDRQKRVCTSEDEVIYGIHSVAALTHNHLRSSMCCGMYYFMVKHILDGKEKGQWNLQELLQAGVDEGRKYYGRDLHNLQEMDYLHRIVDLEKLRSLEEEEIRSSGYVIDTIEAAVWCLITTDSLKECLLKAVNLADDADTVAAVAGGLAGLFYGYEAIPEEWLAVIQKKTWLDEILLPNV